MKQGIQKFIQIFYKNFVRTSIFLFNPEKVHNKALNLGKFFGKNRGLKKITRFLYGFENHVLEQKILGITFKNPVGLAAGFDKNAEMIEICPDLNFGFTEVGSFTGLPCEGNPKPRLWRLIKSKGIIVWYGLKNDGVEKIHSKIRNIKSEIPVGINIARTNSKEVIGLDKEIPDYVKGFKIFSDFGDYFTLNISCPNTCGGAEFHNPENLELLLKELSKLKISKPVFIKLTPDLSEPKIDKIIDLARKYKIKGFIASNLTKNRKVVKNYCSDDLEKIDPGVGGISGKPVEELANNLIKYIYQKTRTHQQAGKSEFVIVGCGGIFSAKDAYKKIRLGASLVQLITGMIFEGPQLISQINRGLVKLLKKDGFKNISEAVGVDA
ncbi:quinone-dependent dihydroorotate dehydrogenase [Candidatus Wolfebacteria bacterium]|nr:quinone-dependent dihydroorotate dehydrogenase [Candidatus Wolfebacteria bacterium]